MASKDKKAKKEADKAKERAKKDAAKAKERAKKDAAKAKKRAKKDKAKDKSKGKSKAKSKATATDRDKKAPSAASMPATVIQAPATPTPAAPPEETYASLRARAKELRVPNYSRMSKAELQRHLVARGA